MERMNPVNLRVSDDILLEVGERYEGFVPFTYDDKDPKAIANKTPITAANARMVDGRLTGPWGGTLTKGYGHTRTAKPGDRITREEALSLLRSDAREAESCVWRNVRVPLTQGEFNGMWDLFFNVGPGSLPNEQWPNGKDGIACLGKTGGGRPSTLLTKLNEGDYKAAAECFTQWRNKGTIWEWGLTKRRILFMLIFMGLPIARAMLALPNVGPATDGERVSLVQKCINLAKDELADVMALQPAPKPDAIVTIIEDKPAPPPAAPISPDAYNATVDGVTADLKAAAPLEATIDGEAVKADPPPAPAAPEPAPAPDVLVLDKIAPPSAAAPDSAGAAEAPKDPSPAASPPAPPMPEASAPAAPPPAHASEEKNPVKSTTIWGAIVLSMAPQLEQVGNELIRNSVIGGTIGKICLVLGAGMVVMGRMTATKALSFEAPMRKPK